MAEHRPDTRDDFEIAIICALLVEAEAVLYLFNKFWDTDGDPYGKSHQDTNEYRTGRIGQDDVVLVILPGLGRVNAADAVRDLLSSYSRIRLCLLVGICGGVPSSEVSGHDEDIRLGDVVISRSIVQYDFGRQYPGNFIVRTTIEDSLPRAQRDVRALLNQLGTVQGRDRLEHKTAQLLIDLQQAEVMEGQSRGTRPPRYRHPGASQDKLFEPKYQHRHRSKHPCTCADGWICETAAKTLCIDLGCEEEQLVSRSSDHGTQYYGLAIHVGVIASGDAIMRSGEDRDRISREHKVIAFEMEGAGIWDTPRMSCIVIKGVCNYADSHKNEQWQYFAAATAASAAVALLGLRSKPERGKKPTGATEPRDSQPARKVAEPDQVLSETRELEIAQKIAEFKGIIANLQGQIQVLREQVDSLQTLATPISYPRGVSRRTVEVVDARGRMVGLILDTVTSKELFVSILKDRFEDIGTRKIERDEWYLENADGTTVLDLSRPWTEVMKPGTTLYMGMIFRRQKRKTMQNCPSCQAPSRGKSDELITCHNVTCGLVYSVSDETIVLEVDETQRTETLEIPKDQPKSPFPRPYLSETDRQADEDMSLYKRLRIIYTDFEVQHGKSERNLPTRPRSSTTVTLHKEYMQDVDFLAAYLSDVCGLPDEECLAMLQDYSPNFQAELGDQISAMRELSITRQRLMIDFADKLLSRFRNSFTLRTTAQPRQKSSASTAKGLLAKQGPSHSVNAGSGQARSSTAVKTDSGSTDGPSRWGVSYDMWYAANGYYKETFWICDRCGSGLYTKLTTSMCLEPYCQHRGPCRSCYTRQEWVRVE
ncbi:hypothetical protein B0T21DRAFT_102970 [Apiosordaria backusii]|uniref:Nucleoside phosphorylase domain-containing protein n=1 Tax=Apiosordaria backusii TaxID=314023 RepID=A0AA40DJR7_9PEZI|nr:hypothetical protein B0T21DRAFT_102970 [Apiosordaria backusii]